MKVLLNDIEYPLPVDASYRVMRIAKRVSGLLPHEMYDGIAVAADGTVVAIDPDAAVAFAAVALAADDPSLTWQAIQAQLDALEHGTITFDLTEETDADAPPSEAAGAAAGKSSRHGSRRSTRSTPAAAGPRG